MKDKKYKAVIIGAGNIAAQVDAPEDEFVLTHAHAFNIHSQVELLGFYDMDSKKADESASKWSTKAFASFDEAMEGSPDIVSVCTNNESHFNVLLDICNHPNKPKLIICEKPATLNSKDTLEIINISKEKGISILVNHVRRFDPFVQSLAKKLDSGEYGKVLSSSAIYTKGILHNGTHVIDLARLFLGEASESEVLCSVDDYNNDFSDKTIGAFIEFDKCGQFHLMAGDERKYSCLQFEMFCEKARLSFTDLGSKFLLQPVIDDPVFKGYKILGPTTEKNINFDKSMLYVVDNAVNFLDSGQELFCDINDTYKTQQLCETLLKKSK